MDARYEFAFQEIYRMMAEAVDQNKAIGRFVIEEIEGLVLNKLAKKEQAKTITELHQLRLIVKDASKSALKALAAQRSWWVALQPSMESWTKN